MKRASHGSSWSIVEAKSRLSEIVAAARDTGVPQRIAKRGSVVAVVIDNEKFEAMCRESLAIQPEAGWQAFLARSAELRAEGGATLRLPRRRGRRQPKLGA